MVVSGLLIKWPYWIAWQVSRLFGRLQGVVFYMESEHDYRILEYILPHIKGPFVLVARNRTLADKLKEIGVSAKVWPAFPSLLIMTRHAFHRFPIKDIRKIGMMHGPYYFKRMISPKKYNMFDLFLFTSEYTLNHAVANGVENGVIGGYSRIDAFKDPKTKKRSLQLKNKSFFSAHKKTLLFSATWDKSGQSAIDRWVDYLPVLTDPYNIVVSLHPMMSQSYVAKLKNTQGIKLVGQQDLYAAMMMADILVCDTSSIIAEFCVLDKPIITFKVKTDHRLTQEIQSMISDISLQITTIDELDGAVQEYLDNLVLKKESRQKWVSIMYDDLSISHGEKAAALINDFIDLQAHE